MDDIVFIKSYINYPWSDKNIQIHGAYKDNFMTQEMHYIFERYKW